MITPNLLKIEPSNSFSKDLWVRKDIAVLSAFFLITLLVEMLLALHWHRLSVFYQFNVIFDSDPNLWLRYHSKGGSSGTITHPLLAYYAFVPITVISKIASILGISDPSALREMLAVFVSPLTAAIKNVLLYLTFRLIGLSIIRAAIVTSIGALSFSGLVFGAVPSSYPFTGLMMAILYFFLVLSLLYTNKKYFLGILFFGFLAIGVTTSNAAHLGWVLWSKFVAKQSKVFSALAKAVAVSVVVLIASLVCYALLHELRGGSFSPSGTVDYSKGFVEEHTPSLEEHAINFLRFPERAARTYLATVPETKKSRLFEEGTPYDFELTYNTIEWGLLPSILSLIAVVVIGGGFIIALRLGGIWRLLGICSLLSFGVYWLLYTYFGYNTYLYSQHWQVSQLFLMAPWFCSQKITDRKLLLIGLCIIVFMIGLSINALSAINHLLAV